MNALPPFYRFSRASMSSAVPPRVGASSGYVQVDAERDVLYLVLAEAKTEARCEMDEDEIFVVRDGEKGPVVALTIPYFSAYWLARPAALSAALARHDLAPTVLPYILSCRPATARAAD